MEDFVRTILPDHCLSESALKAIENFHPQVVKDVQDALTKHRIVVVGMRINPFVRKARQLLTDRGLDFHYLEFGGYLSHWKPRLALKLWSGWPTFPQVFIEGRLIGGYTELLQSKYIQKP